MPAKKIHENATVKLPSIATTEIYLHLDRSRLRQEILDHHPRNRRH
ncbi:hypothetical protein [Paramuribaculum intestinale]|nr:hypothetical protein [Paramuribaculum intestinale]